MKNKNFAVFILSHGRADRVITYNTLKKCGYTGKIYIICDNEDNQVDLYKSNFGKNNVIIFDKLKISKTFDTADNFNNRKTIVYARNASFNIAKDLGIDYFIELDDDYTNFTYRKEIDGLLTQRVRIKQLDKVFDLMIDFLKTSNADTVAMCQGGDFVGGLNSKAFKDRLLRKAMNSFILRTDRPFKFLGRINEDVNTYTYLGSKGYKIFSIADIMLNQLETQSNKGGMTETYLDAGTYLKSFYTVMFMPSAVKIGFMGNHNMRIHHKIKWNNCVPKILNEKYKRR